MQTADLIRMARARAGLSQEQLAARCGRPRSTIARWEAGSRSPSLESLEDVVGASGLELVISLAEADRSFDPLIDEQLSRSPEDRLRRLVDPQQARAAVQSIDRLAAVSTPVIVIGSMAAALQGGPQRPRDGAIEVVAGDRPALLRELEEAGAQPTDDEERFAEVNRRWRWVFPGDAELIVVDRLSGARDYVDLRRSRVLLSVGRHTLQVAHPRDLLRLADASPREADRAYAPGLRALLRRQPAAA